MDNKRQKITIAIAGAALFLSLSYLGFFTVHSMQLKNADATEQEPLEVVEVIAQEPEVIEETPVIVEEETEAIVEEPEAIEESEEVEEAEEEASVVEETPQAVPEQTTPAFVPYAAPASETGTPVDNHGKLGISGTSLVDQNGAAYQLRGVSTHGLAWFPGYVNYDSFKTLRDEWGVNCVRLAMYSAEYGGYCTGGNQNDLKNLVNNGVDYATQLGMYVIIDWHVLGEGDPNTYKSEAISFFTEMSAKYANYSNVIYEICNEPNGGVTWSQVKSYANEVIPVIKANDPNAVIIVGTPTWSQDVNEAAADPITGYTNIMYALHFYAATHGQWLRDRMISAINSGIPIFVSEFGICDASGSGGNDYTQGEAWINTMNSYGVSYNIWSLCNKNETSALISSSTSKTSSWSESELSDSGRWYVGILGNNATLGSTVPSNSGNGGGNDNDGNNGGNNGGAQTPSGGNASAVAGTLNVAANNTGGWNDGTSNFYQYTVTLSANGGYVDGWTVTVDFGTPINLDQSWSGNYTVNGNSVTITPVDYNSYINEGGSCEVGFIFSAAGSVGDPVITVN